MEIAGTVPDLRLFLEALTKTILKWGLVRSCEVSIDVWSKRLGEFSSIFDWSERCCDPLKFWLNLGKLCEFNLVGGIPSPLKNMKVRWDGGFNPLKNMKVSWEYYSQYMESHKIPWFQTTNQPGYPKSSKSLDYDFVLTPNPHFRKLPGSSKSMESQEKSIS